MESPETDKTKALAVLAVSTLPALWGIWLGNISLRRLARATATGLVVGPPLAAGVGYWAAQPTPRQPSTNPLRNVADGLVFGAVVGPVVGLSLGFVGGLFRRKL